MTSILTNVTAMAASRELGLSADGMQSTIERLTTGKRINSSADNAAGLANADQFNAESIIAAQDVQTANNGYFAAQASDGYLQEATNQVQTLVQLYAGGNGSTAEASSVLADANAAMTKAGQSPFPSPPLPPPPRPWPRSTLRAAPSPRPWSAARARPTWTASSRRTPPPSKATSWTPTSETRW